MRHIRKTHIVKIGLLRTYAFFVQLFSFSALGLNEWTLLSVSQKKESSLLWSHIVSPMVIFIIIVSNTTIWWRPYVVVNSILQNLSSLLALYFFCQSLMQIYSNMIYLISCSIYTAAAFYVKIYLYNDQQTIILLFDLY